MEQDHKVRFSVMYTAQTRRKKKIWHDGHAIYTPSKGKLVLKDDNQATIAGHWVYREPRQGEEIAFDSYLVQIDGIEEEVPESQQQIEFRVRPVESTEPGQTGELQQLLNKWKRGKLYAPGQEHPTTTETSEVSRPEIESSFDPVADLIRWDPQEKETRPGVSRVVELSHRNGDSVFDLIDSVPNVPEPQPEPSPNYSLLENISALNTPVGLSEPPLAALIGSVASARNSVVAEEVPQSPESPVRSPVRSLEYPESPNSRQPILLTSQQSQPSPPSTQDDPVELPRQSGPSLESLLAPRNHLPQGLHGLHRDSLHESFKTAAQIESEAKVAKPTKKAPDEWMKRVPDQPPDQGRWTWEGYWLVDYSP